MNILQNVKDPEEEKSSTYSKLKNTYIASVKQTG
jgi:hypothetical protein